MNRVITVAVPAEFQEVMLAGKADLESRVRPDLVGAAALNVVLAVKSGKLPGKRHLPDVVQL